MPYDDSVFINCPFDSDFAPLLEAMIFCVVRSGLTPRLASERLEAGENRLDKIIELIAACRYSIHDLSRTTATAGAAFRMNMPFELGLDMGRRRAPDSETKNKRFIIFEGNQYELKRALSDLAGQDVEFHKNDYQIVFKKLRDFLSVEAGCSGLPGKTALMSDYDTFQGWMIEKKIHEGHTENEALELPTAERLQEMREWMRLDRPTEFLR